MDVTPLLVVDTGATVLGLRYLATWSAEHGRARGEQLSPGTGQFDVPQRIGAVEGSLTVRR